MEITPTTDDVEVRDIQLSFQYEAGAAWVRMSTRLTGGPVIRRSTTAAIEVLNPWAGHTVYAAMLWLNIRRTPYRTWFRVRVE